MMLGNRLSLGAALLTLLGIGGPCANAADITPPQEPPSEWTFSVAPYAWLAGLKGDVAAFGAPEVDVDLSISEVLEHFDMGVMGAADARNGRWSIATDLMWAKLSGQQDTPFGVLANNVELTAETLMVTGAGAYSLIYGDGGNLDVMAGARVWSVSNDLDFHGGFLDGRSVDQTETWVDPVVGLKGRLDIGGGFYLTSWGFVGGFGVASKFMWDFMAGVGYELSDSAAVVLAYRALAVDYHNEGFVYDVTQQGPMLGVVFRF